MNDFDRTREALSFVPADDRETWWRMGMAVKAELGEPGFDLWDEWSQGADNYRPADARDVWKSIHVGQVTMASLIHEAKAHGWRDNPNRPKPSPEAQAEQRRQRAEKAAAEQSRLAIAQERAAAKAVSLWQAAAPASLFHGYLVRKGIQPHGARVGKDGWLLIPMRDGAGKLWNLERVAPDPLEGQPSKKGLHQGRRTGCFHLIGNPEGAAVICLAEGFATGASIHEATGLPVAISFTCGNLGAVAKTLRTQYPDLPLLVCADDDAKTPGNPGRAKAEEAAAAVGGIVAAPIFPGERPDGATDFNDLAQCQGPEAVRRILAGAVAGLGASLPSDPAPADAAEAPEVFSTIVEPVASLPAPVADAGGPVAPSGEDGTDPEQAPQEAPQPDPGSPFPGDGRPCYVVLDDWVELNGHKWRPGVYWCVADADKAEKVTLIETWFCSPLHIEALTFDGQSNNFGRLLRFKNSLGKWRQWAMPMELLRGSGEELRGELLAMGVELDPYKARQQLPAYLQREHPKRKMRCALQVGWAGTSFVLPDRVIGPDAAGVIFQSGERGHDEFTLAGTLAGWQAGIAARALGNPLLGLAIAASFAGPLLGPCHAEGGGIHFVGDSSTGKTTAIEAACATWGGPQYRRSWRATANGLEGAGVLFNDLLLALDEISECDPRQVGEITYMIGNGRGKQRASRTGSARGVTRWRCFVLSSGERTLGTAMAEGGHRAKAGQAVRLLDIPMARAFGAWDDLQGATTAAGFSDALKKAAAQHHGHAGRAFLEKLTHDARDFGALLEEVKALPLFATAGGEGQDKRAAGRFALIGLAGELATEYGLTGWPEGIAIRAAAEGLRIWRAARGTGNGEQRQIAERVSDFLERHGDGRFSDADRPDDSIIRDRAGWWRDGDQGREYLLTAEAMREALRGFDFARGLDALQEIGALPAPGSDGKRAKLMRIGGRGAMRLYPVNPEKLAGGDHGA